MMCVQVHVHVGMHMYEHAHVCVVCTVECDVCTRACLPWTTRLCVSYEQVYMCVQNNTT